MYKKQFFRGKEKQLEKKSTTAGRNEYFMMIFWGLMNEEIDEEEAFNSEDEKLYGDICNYRNEGVDETKDENFDEEEMELVN
jgi:hypothetical protein